MLKFHTLYGIIKEYRIYEEVYVKKSVKKEEKFKNGFTGLTYVYIFKKTEYF